jgi:hypothetical protein
MDQSAGAQTQYALTRNLLDRKGTLPISEAEYRELRGARDSLLMLLSFEEKFEAVTQNFLEFESELLNSTMQYVMNRAPGYQWFFAKRALLNRKLSNLLSAARSYSSYGRGYVAPLFGQGSPEEGTCLERFEKLYQANSFIEALRNHAQHHGIPTHVRDDIGLASLRFKPFEFVRRQAHF